MRPSRRPTRGHFTMVLACLALGLGNLSAALENGQVATFGDEPVEGSTSTANQVINLDAVSSRGLGSAFLDGTMPAIEHTTSANISGVANQPINQRRSNSGSTVKFVDSVTVNTEAVPEGTELIATVSWIVDGTATSTSTAPEIKVQGKFQLDGVDGQRWVREEQNFGTPIVGDLGVVSFDYPVLAGQVLEENISMQSTTTSICGLDPSFFPTDPGTGLAAAYDCSATANMTVTLMGVTQVRTEAGQILYKWTTASESGLPYGSLDSVPPLLAPELVVTKSPAGKQFTQLTWPSATGEFYTVETSTNLVDWEPKTEVLGTGEVISISLPNNAGRRYYRVAAQVGTGNPSQTPEAPDLLVGKSPGGDHLVRLTWQSRHWENYQLLRSTDLLVFTPVGELLPGDGGAIVLDFPTSDPTAIYKVEASTK